MAEINRIPGDLVVGGTLTVNEGIRLPAGALVNADISSTAAVAAFKSRQHHSKKVSQAGTAVTATEIIHVVCGLVGTLQFFKATNIAACAGSSTVTVDLYKNGSSVLSTILTLDSATGARGEEEAAFSNTSVVADDVLEVVITINQSGTDALASGVYAELRLNEDYPLV